MGLIHETTPDAAARAVLLPGWRNVYRSDQEIMIREAVERWGRPKWPTARVLHELVFDRGTARADIAFIEPANIIAIEIKSDRDDTKRLVHQINMFRMAVPELWIISPHRHIKDAECVRHNIISVGIGLVDRPPNPYGPLPDQLDIVERNQAIWDQPIPEATLSLLWKAELIDEAQRAGMSTPKSANHAKLVQIMLRLTWDEQIAAVCRQLRARRTLHVSDPPIALH
jgi:hypothetical protein